ncbi:hypothetical protein D3C80_1817440 [compost metagenome]
MDIVVPSIINCKKNEELIEKHNMNKDSIKRGMSSSLFCRDNEVNTFFTEILAFGMSTFSTLYMVIKTPDHISKKLLIVIVFILVAGSAIIIVFCFQLIL